MGASTIKRDALRYSKRTMRKIKHLKVPVISIAIDVNTKEVLCAGVDHSAVVTNLKVPDGTWEIREVPFWL